MPNFELPSIAYRTLCVTALSMLSFSVCIAADSQPNNGGQTVIRTSSENEITIAVESKTPSENTAINAAMDNSIEQKALFRIYRSNLLKKTYQHVIYPDSAIDKNQQGDVILKVLIKRSGKVKSVEFDSRSTFSSLNKAATRAVKKAIPYPPAPTQLEGDAFEVLMPIKFRLAD